MNTSEDYEIPVDEDFHASYDPGYDEGEAPIILLPDDVDLESFLDSLDEVEVKEVLEHLTFDDLERDLEDEIAEELRLGTSSMRDIFSMPKFYSVTAMVVVSLLGVLLLVGLGYYILPISQRPLHHLHAALRPSGPIGMTLGIVGTAVMVASLGYLWRKRRPSNRALGSLRAWMGFHIFAGLIGPALIVFHAALVPYSALGMLAFFGMVIVLVSGVVGRYIYVYFPRTLEGKELEVDVLRKRLVVYRKKLVYLGVSPALLRLEASQRKPGWSLVAFLRVFVGDPESRLEYRRLREAIAAQPRGCEQTEQMKVLVKRLCRERQWTVRYGEFRLVMGSWRFLHRWLAIVMFAAVLYHVLINIRFGFLSFLFTTT